MTNGMSREDADRATVGRYIGPDMDENEEFGFALIGEVCGDPDKGVFIWRRHYDGEKYITCPRGPDDAEETCPLCMSSAVSTSIRAHLAVYGTATHRQHILKMSYGWLKAQDKGRFKRNPPKDWAFTLIATGAKKTKDRRYEVDPAEKLTADEIEAIKAIAVFSNEELGGAKASNGGSQLPPPVTDRDEPGPSDDDLPF